MWRKARVALALSALLAVASLASQASARPRFPELDYRQLTITLERNACIFFCPAYKLEIHGDGSVVYTGDEYVMVKGVRRTQVSPEAIRRLVDQFREAGFFSLRDSYRSQITDQSTVVVGISDGRHAKRVEDYAGDLVGMPPTIRQIERAIDEAAGSVQWVGTDEERRRLREAGG
jgi:hypothetical protein